MNDQTEAILARHLDRDFRVLPMANSSCNPVEVATIAERLGVRYPPEFVAHVCGTFPGIYVEVKEEVWPRPKPYEVGEFWSFLYALHSYTPDSESEEWMRLESAAESLQSQSSLRVAPILRVVGDADLYCVDALGRILQWKHEVGKVIPVSLNFWSLLEMEVENLCERKARKTA